MKRNLSKVLLTAVFGIVFLSCFNAEAQSRDSEHPTSITGSEISGSASGSETVYYAFDVLRNERIAVELRVTHSEEISLTLDFRDIDAGTLGREGDLTYYLAGNGGSGKETVTGSFTATRRQRVLLMVNYSGRGSYNVRLTRSGGLDDTLIAKEPTKIVPSLPPCVDLEATSINFIITPASKSRSGKARLWVDGIVTNISSVDYNSQKSLQSIQLWEKGLGGIFLLVKELAFTDLAAGEDTQIKYDRALTDFDRRNPPVYRLQIIYAEGIRADGNPANDDCRSSNDSLLQTAVIR